MEQKIPLPEKTAWRQRHDEWLCQAEHGTRQFQFCMSNCMFWVSTCQQTRHNLVFTSSSGTPNLRRSCLAFFRESLLRSASVPVTVFLTGCGSLSSWWKTKDKYMEKKKKAEKMVSFGKNDTRMTGIYFRKLTFCWVGLFGTFTYEKPSPQPVGSATPVTSNRHFPFMAEMKALVVFQGAVRTCGPWHRVSAKMALCFLSFQTSSSTSSSIFIWKSSSFSSSGAKKDFSPYPASCNGCKTQS